MPRSQGFARGDLDAAFPLDDKFLALRGSVSVERYYQATGVYFHIAAATWREAERKPASKVCPDAGEIIDDLVRVGLLDSDGCVTRRAYMHTVGRAKAQRRTASDRQARNRAGMSRVTPRDNGVTNAVSPPARVSALYGTDSELHGPENVAREDDEPEWPVLSWLASVGATVAPNGSGYHREIVKLVNRRGAVAVLSAMKARYIAGDRSERQLIYGAANDLEPIARPTTTKPAGGHTRSVQEVEDVFNR